MSRSNFLNLIREDVMIGKRILFVDDDKDLAEVMSARFRDKRYLVFTETESGRIFDRITETVPDLIILDVMMPGINGFEIKKRLNQRKQTANIPLIFLTAKTELSYKVEGYNLGIDDYVTKPFDFEELSAKIEGILKRREYYEEISMTDGITGLYNVNFFKKHISMFFNFAKRYGKVFSLGIMDINGFKKINDTYGHAAGDCVLQGFAAIAKKVFRSSDTFIRYGGDEFAVLMPETDYKEAALTMERLKEKLKGETICVRGSGTKLHITIAMGIAEYHEEIKNETELFELADKRLYEDKPGLPEQDL